jgi:FKBP-type peptidyl-prolyl cis-trans isomerase FkpA
MEPHAMRNTNQAALPSARRYRTLISRGLGILPGTALLLGLLAPVPATRAAPPAFENKDQELLYYWGTTFGQQVDATGVATDADLALIVQGLTDRASGVAPEFGEEYRSLLNNLLVRRRQAAAVAEAEQARTYLAKAAEEKGAIVTDGGVVFRQLAKGKGPRPTAESTVRVHYVGTLRNGQQFDSSRDRGAPLETNLGRVIPCWAEAIPRLQVGGRARFTCPPELAYGEQGNARIPGGSALDFEVELLGIIDN